ncbi:MAG: FliH/SctL family protein [Candidatus Lernaella stagnicola]|nr:FliH/SctL family protein [Candidatus Lernaella stagnicola]
MSGKKIEFERFDNPRQKPVELVAAAQAEARKMVADAKQEVDRIEQQAYEQGFQQGEQAGIKMGMASAQPSVEAIAALLEQLNSLLLQTLEAMEPEVIKIVQLIAERVIHTKIAGDDQVLVRVVKAAMAEVDQKWDATVHVNPQEYETLTLHVNEFERIRDAGKVTLVADADIEPGGCRVETPQSFVDASVRQALANLFEFEE